MRFHDQRMISAPQRRSYTLSSKAAYGRNQRVDG